MNEDDRARKLLIQIEAFEAKVQASERSFSGQKLQDFLQELKRKSGVEYIDSVATLRDLVKKKSDKHNSNKVKSNYYENKTLVYFKWFLDFHGYLRSLKESFDVRVHNHLIQYFYDSPYGSTSPDKSYQSTSSGYASSLDRQISQISLTSQIGSHNNVHKALKDVYKEYKDLFDSVDEEKINKLAERLFATGRQLQRLLREDVPIKQLTLSFYQYSDSKDEATHLNCLFEKIFKVLKNSAQQAKQWVHLDTVRSVNLQLARQRFKDMHKTLSTRIKNLDEIVNAIQSEIDLESEGLHKLLKREERTSDINSKIFEMEDDIARGEDELSVLWSDYEKTEAAFRSCPKNKKEDSKRLQKESMTKKIKLDNLKRDIESKIYCRKLLEGDLDVEMEVKPSIIRFTNHVQEKCETLETELSKNRLERAALIDFLEKLRVDRQRIESEILRQAMLISSLDDDILKHRPSIIPPLTPRESPPPGKRFVSLQ